MIRPSKYAKVVFDLTGLTDDQNAWFETQVYTIEQNPVGLKLLEYLSVDLVERQKQRMALYAKYLDEEDLEKAGDISKIQVVIADKKSEIGRRFKLYQLLTENEKKKFVNNWSKSDMIYITIERTLLEISEFESNCLGGRASFADELYKCGSFKISPHVVFAHELIHASHIAQNEEQFLLDLSELNLNRIWKVYHNEDISKRRLDNMWMNTEEMRTVIGLEDGRLTKDQSLETVTRDQISEYAFRLGEPIKLPARYAYQRKDDFFFERSYIIESIFDMKVIPAADDFIFDVIKASQSDLNTPETKKILEKLLVK